MEVFCLHPCMCRCGFVFFVLLLLVFFADSGLSWTDRAELTNFLCDFILVESFLDVSSQCCVFLEDYIKAKHHSKAPLERHECGTKCKDKARYFKMAAKATNGKSDDSHARFGCKWFGHWRRNIDNAIRAGTRNFFLVTKQDGSIGVRQTVEKCYLLEMKPRHGIEVRIDTQMKHTNVVEIFGYS